MVKNPPATAGDAGDAGVIPGSGRSPGSGNLLQDSSLQIPWTEEAGGLQIHEVTKSQMQLSN